MIRIFKLVLLLVVSQVAFGQAPSNYTNINGRYRWIAGMFDSTFHIPKGTTNSLRVGGSTNAGALFYNTTDSTVYTYTGTQWIKLRGLVIDTTSLSNRINLKLNISDTAAMLAPYLRKVDTASLSNRINLKLNISDTATMLGNYLNNVGYGLIRSGQVVRADSATLASYFLRRKDSLTTTNPLGYVTRKILADTAAAIRSSATSGFVPYTGATQNVNLGQFGLTTKFVQFDTSSQAVTDRRLQWSNDEGTLQFGMTNGATITQRIGLEQFARVKNVDATQINKGEAVYIFGASGDRASVKKADNRQDATSSKTLGVAAEDIPVNDIGLVGTFGVVSNLNLNAYTAGDILYLDSIPGGLTKNKPQAPYHLVFIGVVERANSGNGLLFVNPQNGYELEELHNVRITSPVRNNAILVYDSTRALWIDTTVSQAGLAVTQVNTNSGSGITGGPITTVGTIAADTLVLSTRAWRQKGIDSVATLANTKVGGSGTANYISKFTGTNTIANSVIFENGTSIGINTATPSRTLDVQANSSAIHNTSLVGTNTSYVRTINTGGSLTIGIDNSAGNSLFGLNPYTAGLVYSGAYPLIIGTNGGAAISIPSTNRVGIGTASPDSLLTVEQGTLLKRGVRMSGLPTGVGTKALRIDANGTLSIADTTAGGSGTVTSVATNNGTGITGGTITGAGTLAIDTVVISTRAWRQKGIDSVQGNLTAGLATKLNISDTASMLIPYLRKVDTASLSNRINTKLNISDTATMLGNYVNNVGYGLTKASQVVSADSATLSAYYLRRKDSLTSTNLLGYVTRTVLADSAAAIRAAAGGGSISGSGTTNYIPKFTSSTAVGDSRFFDNGTITFLGNGDVNAAPSTAILSGTGGSGTNIAGAEFRIRGGAGTGTGAGGPITFYTSAAGTTGSAVNAGTEKMRLDASGKLGIGVTSPGDYGIYRQLVVYGGSTGGGITIGSGTSATGVLAFANGTSGTSQYKGYIEYQHANDVMTFATNASERMRITSGGSVGIGTTTIGSTLQINGNAAIGYSASTAAPTNGLVVSGNIGINTSSPTGQSSNNSVLQIVGAGTGTRAQVKLTNSISGNTGTDGLMVSFDDILDGYLYNFENGNLIFGTNNTERARLLAGGGLIIGNGETNAIPSTAIVSATGGTGTNIAGAEFRIRGGASTGNAAGGPITFYTSAAGSSGTGVNAATERMRIDNKGNVGIGVTPTTTWSTVSPVIEFTGGGFIGSQGTAQTFYVGSNNYYDGTNFRYKLNGAANNFQVGAGLGAFTWSYAASGTAGNVITFTTGMTLDNSGNLGIGTTTIGSKLQVNGNAAIGYSASTAAPTNGLAVSGNVGIGTNSPSQKLTVSAAAALMDIVSTTSTQFNGIELKNGGGSLYIGQDNSTGTFYNTAAYAGVMYTSGAYPIVFSTNATQRMRITSGGDVGINTTTIGSRLQVNGNAAIGYSASTAAPTNGLAVSGSVGIGLLSPVVKLAVSADVADSDVGQLRVVGASDANKLLNVGFNTTSNFGFLQPLIAGTGYSNLVLNPNGGNVMVGTTTAAGKFTIDPADNQVGLAITGTSLTSANAQSLIDLAQTWNTTGNPTAIKLNITNTASGASANLMDLQVGAATQFRVTKAGAIRTAAPSGGTANDWKLGSKVASSVVFDDNDYLEVEVGGVAYRVALVTAAEPEPEAEPASSPEDRKVRLKTSSQRIQELESEIQELRNMLKYVMPTTKNKK